MATTSFKEGRSLARLQRTTLTTKFQSRRPAVHVRLIHRQHRPRKSSSRTLSYQSLSLLIKPALIRDLGVVMQVHCPRRPHHWGLWRHPKPPPSKCSKTTLSRIIKEVAEVLMPSSYSSSTSISTSKVDQVITHRPLPVSS